MYNFSWRTYRLRIQAYSDYLPNWKFSWRTLRRGLVCRNYHCISRGNPLFYPLISFVCGLIVSLLLPLSLGVNRPLKVHFKACSHQAKETRRQERSKKNQKKSRKKFKHHRKMRGPWGYETICVARLLRHWIFNANHTWRVAVHGDQYVTGITPGSGIGWGLLL